MGNKLNPYKPSLAILLITLNLIPFMNCSGGFQTEYASVGTFKFSENLEFNNENLVSGKALYDSTCLNCHGPLESSAKKDRSAEQISTALKNIPQMQAFQFTSTEIQQIALALKTQAAPPGTPPVILPETPPPPNTKLVCAPEADPSPKTTRRLSYREYMNTMVSLLKDNGLIAYADRAYNDYYKHPMGELVPLFGSLPEDFRTATRFSKLDQNLSSTLTEGQFMIAQAAASLIAQTARLRNYAGTCAEAPVPTPTCVEDFITSFGKRTFRRPLVQEEIDHFKSLYAEFAVEGPRIGFEVLFESFLTSPQFLFILEGNGTPIAGKQNIVQLNDYELASRLSYTLIEDMPTNELMAAADAGKLTTSPTDFAAQVDKLMSVVVIPLGQPYWDVRTHALMVSPFQRVVMRFYEEWIKADKAEFPAKDGAMALFMNIYNNNQFNWKNLDSPGDWSPVINESRDFLYRLTFDERKKFADLLTDNTAVIQNQVAMNYYLLPTATPAVITLPNRAGILTRAGFLTTGVETTNPFLRGAFLRRNLLCDDLPSPDPDNLPDRSLASASVDLTKSARERYTEKTNSPTCMSCHSQINGLGFAMEDFDSLGRNRSATFEPVISVEGGVAKLLSKVPVNAQVTNISFTPNDNINVNGGIQLSQALAASEKANTCFVRQAYRFTNGRMEATGDQCQLLSMYEEMNKPGGSIMGLFKAMVMHPHFKLKNRGQ